MDTISEEQTPAPEKKNTLHRVLIVTIAALVVFIAVCLSLTVYLIVQRAAAEPRPMVLRHPSGETVPAGRTRSDLEQAMELSKNWTSTYIKGAFSDAGPEELAGAAYPIQEMLSSGRIAAIPNGTRCLLTDSGWKVCRVQIADGSLNGQRYWVYRRCLGRTGDTEIPSGLFCGFMCASVYLRYLITAVICCAGIYALKLESVFVQFILFVIGMVVLNLLWARIAMLLLF